MNSCVLVGRRVLYRATKPGHGDGRTEMFLSAAPQVLRRLGGIIDFELAIQASATCMNA